MRKKILFGILPIFVFILIFCGVIVVVKNSDWAKGKRQMPISTDSCDFLVDISSEHGNGYIMYPWINNYKFIDCTVTCEVEKGTLIFRISYTNCSSLDMPDFSNCSLIEEHVIEETGVYTFSYYDLPIGWYKIEVGGMDSSTIANGNVYNAYYYDNWNNLMSEIGLLK